MSGAVPAGAAGPTVGVGVAVAVAAGGGNGGNGGGGGTKPVAFLYATAFSSCTAMTSNCSDLSMNAADVVSTALVASKRAAIPCGGKIDGCAVVLAAAMIVWWLAATARWVATA